MIVLSLFDGMSCGQIALKELGAHVERYYASEVDKFAIAQTQLNFPDTVQLGDVRNIDARKLGHVDLLLGGSPCQSFSFAGKRAGMSTKQNEEIYTLDRYLELKQAGFEFEGQSFLFWEYIRILHELRETNPNVFFLRIAQTTGGDWITDIPQPEDKGILLRDILEDDADVDEKFYLKAQTVQNLIAHKLRNEAAGRNYGAVFHTGGGRCTPLK